MILGKTLSQTRAARAYFLAPENSSSSSSLCSGQDGGIKDCINQLLSGRDSSARLTEGGCRGGWQLRGSRKKNDTERERRLKRKREQCCWQAAGETRVLATVC